MDGRASLEVRVSVTRSSVASDVRGLPPPIFNVASDGRPWDRLDSGPTMRDDIEDSDEVMDEVGRPDVTGVGGGGAAAWLAGFAAARSVYTINALAGLSAAALAAALPVWMLCVLLVNARSG